MNPQVEKFLNSLAAFLLLIVIITILGVVILDLTGNL